MLNVEITSCATLGDKVEANHWTGKWFPESRWRPCSRVRVEPIRLLLAARLVEGLPGGQGPDGTGDGGSVIGVDRGKLDAGEWELRRRPSKQRIWKIN